MASWMLARLKRETQDQLAMATADRLSPLTMLPTATSYRAYLARIHGFEAPVESAFVRTPRLDELVELRGRSQLRLLRADLQALGALEPALLPAYRGVPRFAAPSEALAWMYAIEQNGLVHGQVHRHLARHLPRELQLAGAYLDAGTRARGARLQVLGAALDGCARDPVVAQQIVDAARLAFRRQHQWFAAAGAPQSAASESAGATGSAGASTGRR